MSKNELVCAAVALGAPPPVARKVRALGVLRGTRTDRGFALLEAIVALTILASVGMALFAAISQTVQMVGRAEHAREADSALLNAAAWLETVNPAQRPEGVEQLGDIELRWRAEPIEPLRDGSTGTSWPGLYQVGLYRVHVELRRDGQFMAETEIRRVGYRQVRKAGQL